MQVGNRSNRKEINLQLIIGYAMIISGGLGLLYFIGFL